MNDFWRKRLVAGGAERIMRARDYGHVQMYLPVLVEWQFDLSRRWESIVEFGCGPCGMAPWLLAKSRAAVEPWANEFEQLGIDYYRLGFGDVWNETAQEHARRGLVYELGVCCNVIDHDPEPWQVMRAVMACCRQALLIYDIRHTATDMHPGITTGPLAGARQVEQGWVLERMTLLSMQKYPRMSQEVQGRMCEWWKRK